MILFVGIFAIFSVSFAAHRLAENVTTMTDANINNITVQPRVDSKDIDFSFSFNQNLVTFVRIKGEGRREAISGNMIYDQGVWLRDLGTKQEKLIMANGDISFLPFAETEIFPFHEVYRFESPRFSIDQKRIYFLVNAWVTSDALLEYDIVSQKINFVTPANFLKVIDAGIYKGKLLINQHRYFNGGGSYDHYYIIDTQGKEIKDLGNEYEL